MRKNSKPTYKGVDVLGSMKKSTGDYAKKQSKDDKEFVEKEFKKSKQLEKFKKSKSALMKVVIADNKSTIKQHVKDTSPKNGYKKK